MEVGMEVGMKVGMVSVTAIADFEITLEVFEEATCDGNAHRR